MAVHNIIVNDVQKMENKVVCLARIDNYKNMLKHVSIGESITTKPFDINFQNSIGASKWVLIFYPQGQYIRSKHSTILGSGQVCMYLKMVACENEDKSLMTSIKFYIKSPYAEMKDDFPCTMSATFLYRDLNKRWTGPFNLAPIEKLYSKRCKNFFVNDCLTIGCELIVANSSTYIIRSPSCESLSKRNSDNFDQKNGDAIRRSNRYVQTDNIEEDKKIKAYYTRNSSNSLRSAMEEMDSNGYPALGKSNKRMSNYGFSGMDNQNMGTWHHKLMKSCNERIEKTNNENKPPNCQLNTKTKESSKGTKDVLQVSNTNSGCV